MARQTNRARTGRMSYRITREPPHHIERAFMSAARRSDRSREGRMRSALRASLAHFQHFGFYFYITEALLMEGAYFSDLDELEQLYDPELVLPDGITREDVLRQTPFLSNQQHAHGYGGSLSHHNSLTSSIQGTATATAPVAAPVQDVLPTQPPHYTHVTAPEAPSHQPNVHFPSPPVAAPVQDVLPTQPPHFTHVTAPEAPSHQPNIHFPSPLPQNMFISPTHTYHNGFYIPAHPGMEIYAVQGNHLVPFHPSMVQLAMDPLNQALFATGGMDALALMQAINNTLPHHQEAAATTTSNEPVSGQSLAGHLDPFTLDSDTETQFFPEQDDLP